MKTKLVVLLLTVCTALSAQESPSYAIDRNHDADRPYPKTISVKTNAAAMALFIFNVAGEIDLYPNVTFNLPIYYTALNYFHYETKFRMLSFQPEVRYFLPGAKGMFMGGHFALTYFNMAFHGNWRYQDTDRRTPAWGGGVSIGYRQPFPKNPRWFMEFAIGLGVYDVHYDMFVNKPNGRLAYHDKHKTYFGPDQLCITFGYSFDWHKPKSHEK